MKRLIALLSLTSVSLGTTAASAGGSPTGFGAEAATSAPQTRVAPSVGFDWPVAPHEVIRTFDPPDVRWGAGHRGVDLAAPVGTSVRASGDGVVTFSGVIAGKGVVSIKHAQGFNTTYEPVETRIKVGATVRRGQPIGTLAATHQQNGHCPTVCLHWGYRVSKDEYRDPLTLLRAVKPVLLPPL